MNILGKVLTGSIIFGVVVWGTLTIFSNNASSRRCNFSRNTPISKIETPILSQEWGKSGMKSTYGFKNKSGKWIIKPIYTFARDFSEGLSTVVLSGDWTTNKAVWGFIDKKGKLQFGKTFKYIEPFSDGLALFSQGRFYGFINKSGKIVIKPQFTAFWSTFENGYAPVQVSGYPDYKWGMINYHGKFVIKPIYDYIKPFSDGLSQVKLNNKYGFVDKSGKIVIPIKFSSTHDFYEGLAGTYSEKYQKWGYINKSGVFTIFPRFESVDDFYSGKAWVLLNGTSKLDTIEGEQAFIDRTGKELCRWKDKNGD